MSQDLEHLLGEQIIERLPYRVAIIDRQLNVVQANSLFEHCYGKWEGKKCYEVYKKTVEQCANCHAGEVFSLGETRVSNDAGIDKDGFPCHYLVQLLPLFGNGGEVEYVVEMSSDMTGADIAEREYNLLFDNVPSYISIIDKKYRIVKANKKLRDTFGEVKGKRCYEVYKKRKKKCKNCPAFQTFKDGAEHTSTETGITFYGEETQYIVNTTPLSFNKDGVQLVIEIATDITEINELQARLRKIYDYYYTLIENSAIGIVALDEKDKTAIFNPAAKQLFGWSSQKKPVLNQLKAMLPKEFFENDVPWEKIDLHENVIKTIESVDKSVRFSSIRLFSKNKYIGKAAFFSDLTQLKELERQMLEAERLGAVGETVAGLAHTIKNLLMGLEGGIYIVDSGLRKGDAQRIVEGWEILQRNFSKTSDLVKGFLSFAKGRQPELQPINPNLIIKNIFELYNDTALKQNVTITPIYDYKGDSIYLDPEGIEACLTNLLSNAIDAAMMREDKKGEVKVRSYADNGNFIFEVSDNGCGIDSEIIHNIFTTFFTTKGNKGTGLGLLTTNKIVKEHGGRIEVQSDVGVGSTFRMIFSIERLISIYNKKS